MVGVIRLVPLAVDIAFFLVFPLPGLSYREMAAILFFVVPLVVLILGVSFVPLV